MFLSIEGEELESHDPNLDVDTESDGMFSSILRYAVSLAVSLVVAAVYNLPRGRARRKGLPPAPGKMTPELKVTGETHYIDSGPRQSDATVVIVHGFSGNATDHSQPLAALLNQAGYRTICADNLGRGFSACPGLPHTPGAFVTQLEELLEHLGVTEATRVNPNPKSNHHPKPCPARRRRSTWLASQWAVVSWPSSLRFTLLGSAA